MTEQKKSVRKKLDSLTILFHLILATFGIIAFLTGDWADDYKKIIHDGFDTHGWLGLAVATTIALRLIYGFIGPESASFFRWMPFTLERLAMIWKGLKGLVSMRLPNSQTHRYISGILKSFGLILIAWMAITGTIIYFSIAPGSKATGFVKQVIGMHEIGEALIPVYLVLHIGAVIIHAIFGRQIWKQMVFIR